MSTSFSPQGACAALIGHLGSSFIPVRYSFLSEIELFLCLRAGHKAWRSPLPPFLNRSGRRWFRLLSLGVRLLPSPFWHCLPQPLVLTLTSSVFFPCLHSSYLVLCACLCRILAWLVFLHLQMLVLEARHVRLLFEVPCFPCGGWYSGCTQFCQLAHIEALLWDVPVVKNEKRLSMNVRENWIFWLLTEKSFSRSSIMDTAPTPLGSFFFYCFFTNWLAYSREGAHIS